jgi:hypothetical protein
MAPPIAHARVNRALVNQGAALNAPGPGATTRPLLLGRTLPRRGKSSREGGRAALRHNGTTRGGVRTTTVAVELGRRRAGVSHLLDGAKRVA